MKLIIVQNSIYLILILGCTNLVESRNDGPRSHCDSDSVRNLGPNSHNAIDATTHNTDCNQDFIRPILHSLRCNKRTRLLLSHSLKCLKAVLLHNILVGDKLGIRIKVWNYRMNVLFLSSVEINKNFSHTFEIIIWMLTWKSWGYRHGWLHTAAPVGLYVGSAGLSGPRHKLCVNQH